MKTITKNIAFVILLALNMHSMYAQTENPVISAIQKEVDRNKTELKMEGMPPAFFISYSVLDMQEYNLSASLGSISAYNEYHRRYGLPMLLVGDYLRNNLKINERPFYPGTTTLYDNTPGIAITAWDQLDYVYKNAIELYRIKLAIQQQQTQTQEEKNLPDFEQVKPVNMILQPSTLNFDRKYWENYLRKASETAKQYPDILTSNITLNVRNVMTYTYNTEGSKYAFPTTLFQMIFTANTRADDGQELSHSFYTENATFEQMPDLETYIGQCKSLMENLIKLKNAPVIEDAYSGPVLIEGKSVEYFFRFTFFQYNRMMASPKTIQNNQPQSGNDFELMLDKKIISRSISMKSITGEEFYKGQRLNGYYPIDDEGVVPDKELILIENGVLRNLLNGRKPTKRIQNSNGHVRFDINTGQRRTIPGNILITCNQTFSKDELRKKLIEAAKEEDFEYAYIVHDMFLNLISRIKVADGTEELVRGAVVSDINIKAFKRILGASDKEQIYSFGTPQATVIFPDAMLFEDMDITRMANIDFKKPYIVPKPK